jgi:hypothetical protein
MGLIERLAASWEDASFALVAALAWLSASLLNCPQASVKSVSKAGIGVAAVISSLGPIMDWIDDDDGEFQEDDLEPCGLRGARLVSPPSLTLSQITSPQSVALTVLTAAQRPLRC